MRSNCPEKKNENEIYLILYYILCLEGMIFNNFSQYAVANFKDVMIASENQIIDLPSSNLNQIHDEIFFV